MNVTALNSKNIVLSGKRKILYESNNIDRVILSFKDVTDFFPYSGMFWNLVNEQYFSMLNSFSIKTHFVQRLNLREQEVYNTQALPFGIKITNIISEQYHVDLGLEMGTVLDSPLIEFVKQDDKRVIDQAYLALFGKYHTSHFEEMKSISARVNDLLRAFMYQSGLQVSYMYLSYGFFEPQYAFQTAPVSTEIMLIDDLSPYQIAFWDKNKHSLMPFDIDLVKKLAHLFNIDFTRWQKTQTVELAPAKVTV